MPKSKRPLKAFLCHASQDKPAVRQLSQRLFAEGWIDTWLDEKKLLPGQDWRSNIEDAVETSDIVIICLSSNSVNKEGFVQKELRYAREIALEKPEETIFLIPLRLDECDVPRGLRFYQWADYFGDKKEETYRALLGALKLRYDQKLKIEAEERIHQGKEKLESEVFEKKTREKEKNEGRKLFAHKKAEIETTKGKIADKEHKSTWMIFGVIGTIITLSLFGYSIISLFPKLFNGPLVTQTPMPSLTQDIFGVLTKIPTKAPTNVQAATIVLCDKYSWDITNVDVNLPDNTVITRGRDFTKTWLIKNTGSCVWGEGYKLIFSHGEKMEGEAQPFITTIAPGQEVQVSVNFKAPDLPGTYFSFWTLQNAKGMSFLGNDDKALYVQVIVQ